MKLNAKSLIANFVALCVFAASGRHIYAVAYEAGNPWYIALAHAVGIDGLIIIGINTLSESRRAAMTAILYGSAVSLLFNAASYGAFVMPPLVIAFTMPVALVLAYITVHASQSPKVSSAGQDNAKATRTALDVHVRRESVPASRPTERPVRATVVQPEPSHRPTVTDEVVQRPAIERARRSPLWTNEDEARIRTMIQNGSHSDRAIAREVFGEDATDATRKRIERYRKGVN